MSTDLNNVFGYDITAHRQPRITEHQIVGYPGAHGVTDMFLGSRGSPFVISGRLAASGANYDAARAALDAWLEDLEALQYQPAASYTYRGKTFQYLQFLRFELVPDSAGKVYHFSNSYVFVFFVMHAHILI